MSQMSADKSVVPEAGGAGSQRGAGLAGCFGKVRFRIGGAAARAIVGALALAVARPAAAELKPREVAVVAARGHRQSEALARYYLKARGIPAENLCLVDVTAAEECPRDLWTWGIRPEIRKWLDEHDSEHKLRCLVTVWGVPLKIAADAPGAERLKYQQFLEGERTQRLDMLKQAGAALDAIAAEVALPAPPPGADSGEPAPDSELKAAQTSIERQLQNAQQRTAKLAGAEQEAAGRRLQQLAMLAGGARVMLAGMEKQLALTPDNQELRTQYDALRGRAAAFLDMQLMVDQLPLGYDHDGLMLAAIERNAGLLATVDWLDKQLDVVAKNETGASFDSELALVRWPDDYELLRWQPNYLREGYERSQWPQAFPTLMVARIDAPTIELAKGLVDAALATEQTGLTGKAYFDARGLAKLDGPAAAPGSYEDYDRALLAAAKGVSERTTIETVLNDEPDLFRAGDCPQAALYCGWYSVGKYVDAFDWQPGAVAYHLASFEATTLRDPASQAWCKKMLEDGVAATIGPVYEPYLAAFPRPELFFALLLRGDLTLVECYYRTLPYNSWMMTLIGDPLYRPYKNLDVDRAHAGAAAPSAAASEVPASAPPAAAR
jgi:uncharacterized protein (TIGR03790 family)